MTPFLASRVVVAVDVAVAVAEQGAVRVSNQLGSSTQPRVQVRGVPPACLFGDGDVNGNGDAS